MYFGTGALWGREKQFPEAPVATSPTPNWTPTHADNAKHVPYPPPSSRTATSTLPSSPGPPTVAAVAYGIFTSFVVWIIAATRIDNMLLTVVAPLLFAALPAFSQDIVYDSIHNATPIWGTWSTGSKAVSTGPVRWFAAH